MENFNFMNVATKTKSSKPELNPLRTAKHYRYEQDGFSLQPIGGDKLTYNSTTKKYSKSEKPLDLSKIYLQVLDSEGNFLLGGTITPDKVAPLSRVKGFEAMLSLLDAYSQNINRIIEQQKKDGTYQPSNFKL